MNIIRKENKNHLFDEVNVGEIFEYDNSIFIRIRDTTSYGNLYNAVCIEDGVVTYFMDDDVIQFIDADLVIH